MAHLLKHSTYFVTDAQLEMQLISLSKEDEAEADPRATDVSGRNSDANDDKKALRGVLRPAKRRLHKQHQKAAVKAAHRTWGRGRSEYKWYLFSDCLMVTHMPVYTRLYHLV